MAFDTDQFLKSLSLAFVDCQHDVIETMFTFPMPYYTPDGMVVFGRAPVLVEGLRLYRTVAEQGGAVEMIPRVVAQGMPVRGYSNMWVEWDHIDADGLCKSTSQVRYVLYQAESASAPVIEMVDYTVNAFPEIQQHFPMSATA